MPPCVPWTCCAEEQLDTISECPSCGKQKERWTMRFAQTRRFVVPTKAELEVEVQVDEPPALEVDLEHDEPPALD
ncbi:MAG: hypothetical protein KIT58_15640, partial [Planctomycetota bacterium]|nr:hypothetical protein [Planctomycetota bacterium]